MKMAWVACAAKSATAVGIFSMLNERPQVVINQGDAPYIGDTMAAYRGYTTVAPAYNMTVQQVLEHHLQQQGDIGFMALQAWRGTNRQLLYMSDDHENGGDNWDHTITQANTSPAIGGSVGGIPSQAEVDAHWWVCTQVKQTIASAYSDNPSNIDAPSVDKPSQAAAGTASSQYPVLYFRRGYSFAGAPQALGSSGDVEIFQIDCISGRSAIADVDNASKVMIGANQIAWLKAKLLASTATWKIISSTKKTRRAGVGDNGDVWSFYGTQLADILTYIASNSIKGVIWISSDKHLPHAISQSVAAGDTYDHVCIVGCPISVPLNNALTGALNGIVWQGPQNNSISRAYGVLDLSATQALLYIKRASDGTALWQGRMIPTSNAMNYETRTLGIS